MSSVNNIDQEFYVQIGELDRSIAALSMMKEDLRGEIELPRSFDDELDKLNKMFLGRQYRSAVEKAGAIRTSLDSLYLRVAHEKAKNPTMDDAEEHLAEIKLFIEELRRKAGKVPTIERLFDSMMGEYERKNPKGFFERAGKLRRQLIYYDDMEELKVYLRPIIEEVGALKKDGVHIKNILDVMKEAKQRMKEFNIEEGKRVAERVPSMLEGLKAIYGETTDNLTRAVDRLELAEKRKINTFGPGRNLVKAEKYYREGRYNKANKALLILLEELDGNFRDLTWLEERLPSIQKDVEELLSLELELPEIQRQYSLLRKEVVSGNVSAAVNIADALGASAKGMKETYEEITKLLPVAQRRFTEAKAERKDVSVPRTFFQEASWLMEEGDFDLALKSIKKSVKELIILEDGA